MSGEQAALGHDLRQFMKALGIERAALAGYDWGGRAACIVSALWPERVRCLVSCTGYNLQNIAASVEPAPAAAEHRLWYQYYFNTERGRAGLTKNRRDVCRLLWKLWSPEWTFDEATFERTASSFDNPDFVDVVIQSYRHRYGYAKGDPLLEPLEAQLAKQPVIRVPTINLHGAADGVGPASDRDGQSEKFTGGYERRMLPRIGHNVPQEAPAETVAALRGLMAAYGDQEEILRRVALEPDGVPVARSLFEASIARIAELGLEDRFPTARNRGDWTLRG